MRKLLLCGAAPVMALFLASLTGCEGVFTGDPAPNRPPEIWLSSGPVQGDTTGYQVHFYWSGWDPDGEIAFYEFCFVESTEHGFGFNPADTTGLDKWTRTTANDSVFRVRADANPRPWGGDPSYTIYDKTHTFFIRAVDLEGMRSEPADRSFTAWTLAPIVTIDRPPGANRTYSSVITFGWTGVDPIDSPTSTQDPVAIRYLNAQINRISATPGFNVINHMNANPAYYETLWTPWIPYRAGGDSGRVATIRVDELNTRYVFALQALDDAGAVTATFNPVRNAREYIASLKTGPLLRVSEPILGTYLWLGRDMNYVNKDLPPGIELNFRWEADAEDYGGEIRSYRYGWDIQQLDDPSQWDVIAGPHVTRAEPKTWYSGVHRLLVEAVDNGGRITYGKFEVTVIPFLMERSLLWVDDYVLPASLPANMADPSESVHDTFWVNICRRAQGFRPDRDVYDVRDNGYREPDIRLISFYSNIIWTYNRNIDRAWKKLIEFTPETMARGTTVTLNYLSLFLAQGGRLLTCGRTDRLGGLHDALKTSPPVPASFKFDGAVDPNDTSGVFSMPYRDYCVSVVDKVEPATTRTGDDYPFQRNLSQWDEVTFLYKETQDATPGAIERYPTFPNQLRLGSHVTDCAQCLHRPPRGFRYVEVYNPRYWMNHTGERQLSCFHPMYRMNAKSTRSILHNQTVAIIITKYRERFDREIEQGRPLTFTPANSFHFGFPLWHFNHQDIYTIIDAIFDEWGILRE